MPLDLFGLRAKREAELRENQIELERRLIQMRQEMANQEAERQARQISEALRLAQPSTTLQGQQQLGPVQQAPSFAIQGVTEPWSTEAPPEGPPSLAQGVFGGPSRATFGQEALFPQGGGATTPFELAPSRATWGDEALRPQGGPPWAPPPAPSQIWPGRPDLERAGFRPGGQFWPGQDISPIEFPPTQEAMGGATAYQPPPAPETLGGATAYLPPPPTPPPEYLQRPEAPSARALPETYVPGGERVEIPGRTWTDIIRERPDLAATLIRSRDVMSQLQTDEAETAGRQAVLGYKRAVKAGMSPDDAYRQFGPDMEASEFGRKFVTGIEARQTTEEAQAVARRKAAQEKAGQEYLTARVEKLRATGDPDDAEQADMLEALAADPKIAERMEAFRKQRVAEAEAETKRLEAKKPIVIDNVPYNAVRDPETGELSLKATPGFVRKEKPFWEGKTKTELALIADDPSQPEAIRAQAETGFKRLVTAEKSVQAAGVKPTAQSEKMARDTMALNEALIGVETLIKAHPYFVGTPAAYKWATAYDVPDLLKRPAAYFAQFPKGYDTFRAKLGFFTAEKLNELAGAALTEGEIKRYAAFLPNVYTTQERFLASLQVAQEMMAAAMTYQEVREQGASVKEAQAAARAAIARVANRYVEAYGEPTAGPQGLVKPEDTARQLGIPRRP
jgi:hypothetical protein